MVSAAHSSFQFTHRIGNILLPGLNIVSVPQYLLLCTVTAVLCLLKEYLVNHRIQLSRTSRARRKTSNAPSLSPPIAANDMDERAAEHEHSLPLMSPTSSRPLLPPTSSGPPLLAAYYSSLLYGANLLLAYVVMLLVMSYNLGLVAVIVVASAAGHFCFTRPDDTDEHSRRTWTREDRDGRGSRSGSRGQLQQLTGRRGQADKSSERVELPVDDDPHNEEDWMEKDCCEQ